MEKENNFEQKITGNEAVPETNSDTSDVHYEADVDLDDSVVAEENAQDTIKKLREKLKKAQAEKQEYLDGWQRTKAESVNVQKRNEENLKEYRKFAQENLIEEILPVLQSFDLAIGNKEAWEKVDKNWRIGVEYIYSQLKTILENAGLKEINPLGLPFDPTRDEALENVAVQDPSQSNKVVVVIQKGYSLNGKSLRAPKVKVGEFSK